MKDRVAVSELKTHCLRLVDRVARERRELIVTKRGKPIARLVPIGDGGANEALARLRGTLIGGDRVEDFDTGSVWEATRRLRALSSTRMPGSGGSAVPSGSRVASGAASSAR